MFVYFSAQATEAAEQGSINAEVETRVYSDENAGSTQPRQWLLRLAPVGPPGLMGCVFMEYPLCTGQNVKM